MRKLVWLVTAFAALGCGDDANDPDAIPQPQNLIYRLDPTDPSTLPDEPTGVLLSWDPVQAADLSVYNVYSRALNASVFNLRASTTSVTFHDVGSPDIEYFVTAVNTDGDESFESNTVLIDERLRLERPSFISSTSLDQAIHLTWGDNPALNEPDGFETYRIYSAPYDLDADLCDAIWRIEGTTVSPEFLATLLPNGAPVCFFVTAVSIEGWESVWSDILADTPRHDARNVSVFRFGADAARSGFRFFLDQNNDGIAVPGELGLVLAGDRADIDFWVFADASGDLFIDPVRNGVGVEFWSPDPIEDLTTIDFAPDITYSNAPIQALPGRGYVFETPGTSQFPRFGALRVSHVGDDLLIFDWSFQIDAGNPELRLSGGGPTSRSTGKIVLHR